ncbi:signal peptidase I [Leifsonia shinshuensis]|uniref:signal peptidase I n=1 Tax=Leifsonia shinshuensis TaxID=150026 RepID=UPI001F509DB9|nr:signal peptidase I [Leifsonia shinshuensis]MCI0159257.1 signal peptidase I [Leifsonia shinshuensis]
MDIAETKHGRRSSRSHRRIAVPRIARAAGKAVAAGLLILVCGLLVAAVGVPIATGSDTYTVLTRSMEPGLPPGTLLVVRPAARNSLHVGDVVTYQLHSGKPDVVTHRIVRVEASSDGTKRYITRGDANAVADAAPVRAEQVRGRVWYAIPAIGWLAVVKNSASLQPWLIGVGALLVLYSLVSIAAWLRNKRRRDSSPVVHRETYIPL